MKKITKVASITLYVLLALGVLFSAIAMFGGTIAGDPLETPVYLDSALNYTYFMIIASIGIAIALEVFNLILHPANAKKSLVSFVVVAAVVLIAYLFSDGTPMKIIGYEGSDNVPSMLKLTDTGLITFYILVGIAVISILVTEIGRIFK